MFQLSKTLHVLAVGLWFGMAVFFSFVVAFSLFGTFERFAEQEPRPVWFPLSPEFEQDPVRWRPGPSDSGTGTDWNSRTERPIFWTAAAVRKEQGARAAGAAIGPMFSWYFLLQGVCAVLALVTALSWPTAEPAVKAHRVRIWVLLLAFLTVVAGWPLEWYVASLRGPRDAATDALLRAAPDIPDQVHAQAVEARRAFGMWHGVSTLLNLVTIGLVSGAMALTARLPSWRAGRLESSPAGSGGSGGQTSSTPGSPSRTSPMT